MDKFFLDARGDKLSETPSGADTTCTYRGLSDGLTFVSDPLKNDMELTGPMASKLWISSDTIDESIFGFPYFHHDMQEITFQGALDPHTPIAQGWLRVPSKLDEQKSEVWRPYHSHDEKQPLVPGEVYELDIEVWPTCIVVPRGFRMALSVRGKDYVFPGEVDKWPFKYEKCFHGRWAFSS